MKQIIDHYWMKLIKGPFGGAIACLCLVSAFIFAMWVIVLLVNIIGYPFIYLIDKLS